MADKKPVAVSKVTKPKKKPSPQVTSRLRQHQKNSKQKKQEWLEAALRQYVDLYDFAPVGYITLTQDGKIKQANLTAAYLFGIARTKLVNRRLGSLVSVESRPAYKTFLKNLSSSKGRETGELSFMKKGGKACWMHLDAICFENSQEWHIGMMDITDHKLIEQSLQKSENRFRMLLQDISTVAVQGYVMDGTTQYWNSASEKLYGYTAEEAIGRNLLDLIIPPEMRDEIRQAIKQMAETGQPIPAAELSLMRKGGSRVAVYSSHTIVQVPGREPELFCLDIDLAERRQTEELLRESEWRNRMVSELATDYIFVVDIDPSGVLKLRWASDNMYDITGRMVKDAATSDMWGEVIHPDDRSCFFDFISKILTSSEAGEFECRAFYKDNGERWVRILARPQLDNNGNVKTIVGAIKDITQRKQVEEALRNNQELFSLFMSHSPIHAYIKEVTPNDNRVLMASDNFIEMIGIAGKDMEGKTMDELFQAEFAAKIVADDWAVVTGGKVLKLEEELNGRHYTTIKFPITQGNKTLLAGYTIDITDRKQSEMELEFMKESLKAANNELQEALLRQQQLAHTDALTGVNNRRHLFKLAEHEFDVAIRYRQPLSVVMFDIDHFKEVNDTFGHAVGDQILQLVTQTARAELRSSDVIGRYGGEEFVIVLPMTNAEQAHVLAERIRQGVEAMHVVTTKGEASVTISIGIVEMHHDTQVESFEKLINAADEAMYTAKQAGRNRIEIG